MAAFLETSAVLAAYLDEDGGDAMRDLLEEPALDRGLFTTHWMALEVLARFAWDVHRVSGLRRRRARRQYDAVRTAFNITYPDRVIIAPVVDSTLTRAVALSRAHPERAIEAGDFVHFAAIQETGARLGSIERLTLVRCDKALVRLARDLEHDAFDPREDDLTEMILRQLEPPNPRRAPDIFEPD